MTVRFSVHIIVLSTYADMQKNNEDLKKKSDLKTVFGLERYLTT